LAIKAQAIAGKYKSRIAAGGTWFNANLLAGAPRCLEESFISEIPGPTLEE
jgi:hypothetical protein